MYFNHAFKKAFLLPSGTLSLASSGATSALTAGQLGAFKGSDWSVISATSSTSSTVPFYLVQGSYFTNDKIGPFHGGYKESIKSKLINPKYINRVILVKAKTPAINVVKVPVSCGIACDTTTRLRVDAKGSPALRFLSHNMYRTVDAYSGCCSTTDPTLQKDPIDTLLKWADQINSSPIFNTMVQAKVSAYKASIGASSSSGISSWGTPTTTAATLTFSTNNTFGLAVGQKIVGTGMPANAYVSAASTGIAIASPTGTSAVGTFTGTGGTVTGTPTVGMSVSGAGFPVGSYVSAYTSGTNYVITFPTQTAAPTITGTATISANVTITYPTQGTAPTLVTTTVFKVYNDLYSGATGSPYAAGDTVYIPGTGAVTAVTCQGSTVSAGTSSGTIGASSKLVAATSGAHVYSVADDAASFSYTAGQEPFIELTAGYVETKFGNCTFTPTDKYDLEPLTLITSVVDESGDPCATSCFTTTYSSTQLNTSTIVQAPTQALGTGETVLRDMILSDRYQQIAYPDSGRVESLRMREIESNPALANISRVALFDQVLILHSVPRFNNPSGMFDNDQYLLCFYVPKGEDVTALTGFVVNSANAVQGTGVVSLETIS
jgi:hypothetical protein